MKRALTALLAAATLACGPAHDEHDEHGEHGEHDEHHEGSTEVHLTPEAIARAGITVREAERTVVEGGLVAPAEIALDPTRTAHVSPLTPGRVVSTAAQIGDTVTAGAELAVIASPEAGEARAGMSESSARVTAARAAVDRQRQLAAAGIGTERALIEAETQLRTAQAELSGVSHRVGVYGGRGRGAQIVLTAPIAGVIVEQHATVGEITDPTQAAYVISDPTRIWVRGNVPEMDLAAVRVGATATLRLAAYPGETWRTTIDFVAPSLDERTRTLPVRGHIDNDDGRLRAGLFGRLYIAAGDSAAEVIAVPEGALARVDGADAIFVPGDEEGAFVVRPVTLGRRAEGIVEVTSGLDAGERFVASGAFTLRSELQREQLSGHEH